MTLSYFLWFHFEKCVSRLQSISDQHIHIFRLAKIRNWLMMVSGVHSIWVSEKNPPLCINPLLTALCTNHKLIMPCIPVVTYCVFNFNVIITSSSIDGDITRNSKIWCYLQWLCGSVVTISATLWLLLHAFHTCRCDPFQKCSAHGYYTSCICKIMVVRWSGKLPLWVFLCN